MTWPWVFTVVIYSSVRNNLKHTWCLKTTVMAYLAHESAVWTGSWGGGWGVIHPGSLVSGPFTGMTPTGRRLAKHLIVRKASPRGRLGLPSSNTAAAGQAGSSMVAQSSKSKYSKIPG